MEDSELVLLNTLLHRASEQHSITRYDNASAWFPNNEESADQLRHHFDQGIREGYITVWSEPEECDSVYWNWSVKALHKARMLNVSLVDPLAAAEWFSITPCQATNPAETLRNISIDLLDDDLYGHLDRVYQEQVRYVVTWRDKAVVAIVSLTDLDVLVNRHHPG